MGRRIQLGALPPLPPKEEAGHQKPLYLTWIDRASPIQDYFGGIDAVAHTDAGRLYIQIKSSEGESQKFLRKLRQGMYGNRPFLIITIHEGVDVEDVIDALLDGLDRLYRMVSQ